MRLTDEQLKSLEGAILARLEAKSDHMYQWPRWPAAYEAAMAAVDWLENQPCGELSTLPNHPYRCVKRIGHDGQHGHAGIFWGGVR